MNTQRLKDCTVLIVDDDEDILSSYVLAVRAEGAVVRTATDGNQAMAECDDGEVDAVILDMMLPKRSGFLVLEKMLKLDDPPYVVMVTANQGKRHMEYAKSLGVDAYRVIGELNGLRRDRSEFYAGETGDLYLDMNNRLQRRLLWAQFERGVPQRLSEFTDIPPSP